MAVKRKTIHNLVMREIFVSRAGELSHARDRPKYLEPPAQVMRVNRYAICYRRNIFYSRTFHRTNVKRSRGVRIKIMWKFIQGITCKQFLFFVTAFNILLKMWAPKYQCGRVKLDQLGAHMAPGVLKLFATLLPRYT